MFQAYTLSLAAVNCKCLHWETDEGFSYLICIILGPTDTARQWGITCTWYIIRSWTKLSHDPSSALLGVIGHPEGAVHVAAQRRTSSRQLFDFLRYWDKDRILTSGQSHFLFFIRITSFPHSLGLISPFTLNVCVTVSVFPKILRSYHQLNICINKHFVSLGGHDWTTGSPRLTTWSASVVLLTPGMQPHSSFSSSCLRLLTWPHSLSCHRQPV